MGVLLMDVPFHLILGSMIQKLGIDNYPRWLYFIPVIMSHYYVDRLGFWDEFPLSFQWNFVGVDFAQLIITLSLGAIVFIFLRKYWLGMILSIVPWDICYFSYRLGIYFDKQWGLIDGLPYHQWFMVQISREPVLTIYNIIFVASIVYLIAAPVYVYVKKRSMEVVHD